ncbi:MAG: IS4 family transposase [Akkermansiaceae bacterium]|nr:IS4 family transposase [Verrucomicrobiales bacterium]
MDRTFWCWLWQVLQCNTACREVMKQLSMLMKLQGGFMAENSSAYCQSRKLIPMELLRRIYIHIAQKAWSQTPQSSFLQGRRLKALDGTSVRLADTPANQKDFPQSTSQKAGTGFPVMKIAALFCIGSGAVLAHATGCLWTSELSLAAQLLGFLNRQDVLVADRGFCNYALTVLLRQNQVDVIARVPTTVRKIDFRQGRKRLGSKDALFVWNKPKARCQWLSLDQWLGLPPTLRVRILRVRVRLPGIRVREITLMTTLLDPVLYPAKEIARAYQLRWRQEMCFDDLKTTLEMAHLKSLSPAMGRKELCMFLTAHNVLRCLMAQAAAQAQLKPERISFKGTLDGLRQCSIAMTQAKSKAVRKAVWQQFISGLGDNPVPERPGRSEPRAVKHIYKYEKLNKHRRRYKDRPSRNQRRRQQRKRSHALI